LAERATGLGASQWQIGVFALRYTTVMLIISGEEKLWSDH
jgi:hypothetical protein